MGLIRVDVVAALPESIHQYSGVCLPGGALRLLLPLYALIILNQDYF